MMSRVNSPSPTPPAGGAAEVVKEPSGPPPACRSHGFPPPDTPRHYHWSRQDTWSTAVIGVLALVTRFIGLTSPVSKGAPVFDEKHYVPQAWDMVRSWDNPFIGGCRRERLRNLRWILLQR